MKHDRNAGEMMLGDVLDNPVNDGARRAGRHRLWFVPPALIRPLIDVAMIASKVATGVNLDNVFAYRPHVGKMAGRHDDWLYCRAESGNLDRDMNVGSPDDVADDVRRLLR